MILDNLKSARTAKTSERLRIRMLFASLSRKKGSAHVAFTSSGKVRITRLLSPSHLTGFSGLPTFGAGRQARLSCHGREV